MDIRPTQMAPSAIDADETRNARIKEVARDLEAAFLTQMLTIAGVGKSPAGFDGGAGETHFSSFLVSEYATRIADSGGLGLAEHIFQSMVSAEEHS